MAYWLVKSEPGVYGWEQFCKDKQTTWDGIRNYAARNHLKAMKKGDEVFFYHSNQETAIVGIAKVTKEHYTDASGEADKWFVIDLKPVTSLKNPVTLAQVKADKRLSEMALVRIGRLSVQPVSAAEWKIVLELAEG